jgi:hypothetical protein
MSPTQYIPLLLLQLLNQRGHHLKQVPHNAVIPRLKDLLAKQAQLNACLDLDKNDTQIVGEPDEKSALPDRPSNPVTTVAAPQPPA